VTKALALLRTATQGLKGADIDQSGGAAVDYLRLFALVALGWMWVRMAAAPGDTPQHQAKRALAAFYAQRVLPQTEGLAAALASRRLRCSPCPPTPSDLVRSPIMSVTTTRHGATLLLTMENGAVNALSVAWAAR
jgi:hypothetical protein